MGLELGKQNTIMTKNTYLYSSIDFDLARPQVRVALCGCVEDTLGCTGADMELYFGVGHLKMKLAAIIEGCFDASIFLARKIFDTHIVQMNVKTVLMSFYVIDLDRFNGIDKLRL